MPLWKRLKTLRRPTGIATPSMSTPIRQLLALITKSVDTLETACASSGVSIPDLNEPFAPPSEAFRTIPGAAEAVNIISAAALQLEAILAPPPLSLYHIVSGNFKSAALRICLESGVTEILREAGPQGLHVKDIAAKNGQDAEKLARFIRYLATHHVYREVSPNVFANNRISSMMDTLKPSREILADPEHKHEKTMGLAALASHHLDETFQASAYAWETLVDPATARSGDQCDAALTRAMGSKETLWQLYARPEEKLRHDRFQIGMQGVEAMQPADAVVKAFDWAVLPPKSLVVDVGGGVGTSCLPLATKFPDLRFVVQDLKGVIDQGKELWNTKLPAAINSGQVTLQVHDFFTPQPQTGASIFLLKQIMHDWSDENCKKILTHLWDAAGSDTRLLLFDTIMPLTCHDPSADDPKGIPGAAPVSEAPAPLLANYGAVSEMAYTADFVMFALFNSQERTAMHLVELLRQVGWKITAIHRQPGDSTFLQCVEARKDTPLFIRFNNTDPG
ncbi:S-adenosyl-L-methionine-dependent methyltransferase [Mycena venus]|uniref:S-adenosyl-L-methionine-dependent methyltransferase n=1 Tax=Mycena venus TaxID=2733690 RepID=A0A8H6XLY8_9AGAR|nr:S-adenosyl-L-methionine-dependent methyltransferase [Mycena venus]